MVVLIALREGKAALLFSDGGQLVLGSKRAVPGVTALLAAATSTAAPASAAPATALTADFQLTGRRERLYFVAGTGAVILKVLADLH